MALSWGNSIREFKKTTKKTSVDMNKRAAKVTQLTAMDVKKDAQRGTPKLTGRLRAGWKVVKVRGRGKKSESDVVNDVPYGPYVENGTSNQAPRRMLAKAVIRGKRHMKRRLEKAGKENAKQFNSGKL